VASTPGAAASRSRLGYVPALDGLRALAILPVVFHHFFVWPQGGALGVDLFFVLSGFLITTLLLEERAVTGSIGLRRFYTRRARRLLPALAALLLGYPVLAALRGRHVLHEILLGGLYTGNISQAFLVPNPLASSGIDHLWSLAMEEQFYFVWPCLLLLVTRSRRIVLWLSVLLVAMVAYRLGLVASGVRLKRIYMGPDTHCEGLAAGALLAAVRFYRPELRMPEWVAKTSLSVAVLAVIAVRGGGSPEWAYGLPVFELAAVGMVAAAVTATALAEALAARPLVWLGTISYSIYLWHEAIRWTFGGAYPLGALPLSIAVAWLSYRYVEQPFRHPRQFRVVRRPEPANTP
jgi:peptidoglycan/LPS O-acetylase OafA/YrhL